MNKKYKIIIGIVCFVAIYLSLPTITFTCQLATMPDSEICLILERMKFHSPVNEDIWNESSWSGSWSGDGYEDPFSGKIELLPSEKNTQSVILEGGVICDSDENLSECLDNAPNISIDGISVTEFIPFILPILFLVIGITVIIIWKYRKK